MAKKQMEQLTPDKIDAEIERRKTFAAAAAQPKPLPEGTIPYSSADPNVIDAMYRTAELMSSPPTGLVTFQAFATLPPITTLSGDREQDLSKMELAECWADGSMGATRVDRTGFERVWMEVQEYFEEDIMEEARRTCHKKVKKSRVEAEVVGGPAPVGSSLTEDQMKVVNEQVKNMSDDDVSIVDWDASVLNPSSFIHTRHYFNKRTNTQNSSTCHSTTQTPQMTAMLEGMANIGPEEEARMKAMGADPAMMKKAAEMMKSNPMMRKAAQMMMKNMSPDQMLKASQQAQQQMNSMSKEDMEKAWGEMEKNMK